MTPPEIWFLIITVLGQPTYVGGPYTADGCAREFISVILQVAEHEAAGDLSFEYQPDPAHKSYTIVLSDLHMECSNSKVKAT